MHIDWFVFFSQIVNLLILMFLLKKFLFGRIVGAMDAREAKIAARFAEAERAQAEAETAAAACEQKLRDLEGRYEEMLNKARQDAETYRERLLEKAREEVDFLKNRWIEALRSERENFLQELRQLAGNQIYAITRRVLKDLADIDLEERIVDVLMARWAALDETEREKFLADSAEGRRISISSAYEMPAATQGRFRELIGRYLPADVEVAYERSENVLSGCELRSDGHKLAWSMKDYLDSLEERFYTALQEETQERK